MKQAFAIEPAPGCGVVWPDEVMVGAAGRFSKTYVDYLETPGPFLFMGYLTLLGHAVSDKITLQSEVAAQPRLYTVFLGESADTRKTTAIAKPFDLFRDAAEREINPIWGVGSAEGLVKGLRRNKRVILILDELHALVQKCLIDSSVLLPCINTLFEKDYYQNETSRDSILVDGGQLCLLAASTLDTYETMFKSQFLNIGFNNRLFVVIGESRRKFAIPRCVPDTVRRPLVVDLQEVLSFVNDLSRPGGRFALPIEPEAETIFDEWYNAAGGSIFNKRLETYGHRLMILLAVNQMLERVTPEVAAHTVALLRYQLAARRMADPIQAETKIASLEEKIRRRVKDGPIKKRDLEQRCNKRRYGTYLWNCALGNLEKAEELRYNRKTATYSPGPVN